MTRFIFTFFFCTICAVNMHAQNKTFSLTEVDKAPFITKCNDTLNSKECFNAELKNHIHQNIDIMKLVDHRELPGKAYVQFIITESGEVKEVNVRTHNKYLKEEALRIFADLKIERPARKNSENVAIKHVIPISFNTKNFKSYEDFFKKNEKIPSQ